VLAWLKSGLIQIMDSLFGVHPEVPQGQGPQSYNFVQHGRIRVASVCFDRLGELNRTVPGFPDSMTLNEVIFQDKKFY